VGAIRERKRGGLLERERERRLIRERKRGGLIREGRAYERGGLIRVGL
jgi:hypothetical protein